MSLMVRKTQLPVQKIKKVGEVNKIKINVVLECNNDYPIQCNPYII